MKRILVAALTSSALVVSACSPAATDSGTGTEPRSFPSPKGRAATVRSGNAIERVVEEVLPAVVNVVSEGPQGEGEGTGFIVREDGIVVTNYHVVEGASSVRVLTSDAEPVEHDARVVGGDIQADLAVLDIEADALPVVPLGDSGDLKLGQQVVAIGFALGLEGGPSVTSGIVSSLTRQITVPDPQCPQCENNRRIYTDVIQTDAAINPGNSGGPLVDLAGNVVGINTAGTTAAENIGFAIQVNAAKPTIFHAAEEPQEPVAFMGIGSRDASDPAVQFELNPPVGQGAAILNVVPGGPADRAGVQVGDVIVSFGEDTVGTAEALGEAIRSHEPGDVVEFEVVRPGGERVTLTVELGVNPVPIG